MLQWFIRFPEFAEFIEFPFHLEKTSMPWNEVMWTQWPKEDLVEYLNFKTPAQVIFQ